MSPTRVEGPMSSDSLWLARLEYLHLERPAFLLDLFQRGALVEHLDRVAAQGRESVQLNKNLGKWEALEVAMDQVVAPLMQEPREELPPSQSQELEERVERLKQKRLDGLV